MNAPNRNAAAVGRLLRVVYALREAGPEGLASARLVRIAGFATEAQDAGSALTRDLKHLRNAGWQIDNMAPAGEPGHYVLRNVDARMRVLLDADQQAALRRAALVANRADLADRLGLDETHQALPSPGDTISEVTRVVDEQLQTVLAGLQRHGLLRFRYKHTSRTVHPMGVRESAGAWYLQGKEDLNSDPKYYRISRMSEVRADAAGTAQVLPAVKHTSLQPMHWQVDPPVRVRVRTPEQFVPDAIRWLSAPLERTAPDDQGRVVLTFEVTNRRAFRSRIYELATRVEVLGPEEVRAEIVSELTRMAGEA